MHIVQFFDSPAEMHVNVQEANTIYTASLTVAKVIKLNPKFILGESNLLTYDEQSKRIALSPSFHSLMKLLVQLNELDERALSASTLIELNTILQQPQGEKGGLLRKEGAERWHLEDNSTKQQHRKTIEALLERLGFCLSRDTMPALTVDHGIIFGARAERMEKRILETLKCLDHRLDIKGHIFLLGSTRKLVKEELEFLKNKLDKLEPAQEEYWKLCFEDAEHSTEANAFMFLWETLVPEATKIALKDKLIGIKSTRIGRSYRDFQGHRTTTEVTSEDWMAYFNPSEPQSIFAIAEQPYLRLGDQLRMTVLSKAKKANLDEVLSRIAQTTFYFASPKPESAPLVSVVLDEIARHIYRITDTLKYLESLE